MSFSLRPLLIKSIGIYTLFLIPTLLLIYYAGQSDASLSTYIGGTWQATVWRFPGLGELSSRILLDALETVAIIALGWWFYQGFQRLNKASITEQGETRDLQKTVLIWAAVCGGLLIFTTPFHSSDIFGYLNRGFQQSAFHTNPYLTTISQVTNWRESHLFHAHWIDNPCPYGFFFAQLAHWLTQLANGRFISAYLIFKALNWLLFIATTALIAHIGSQVKLKRPWLAAYLFGANPLVLLHVMGNGHNDIVMTFLLLLSLACLLNNRSRWACLPVLTLSILTKYASLLALPFILLYLLKKKAYRDILLGALVSLLLAGWLASVYVEPYQAWPWSAMLDNARKPQHSLASMLEALVYYPFKWLHLPAAKAIGAQFLRIIKPAFWLGFVGFYGWRLLNFIKVKADLTPLFYEIALVNVVMIAFVSAKFHPWYPVIFLPLALLLPEASRLRQFSMIFCLFQLAGFTILQNLPVFSEFLLTLVPLWLTLKGTPLFRPAQPEN